MRKLLLSLVAVLLLAACTKEVEVPVEKIVEKEVIKEVEVEVEKVVMMKDTFYTEIQYEGSGYTPTYNYYLSGKLNENGEVTQIRFDMVSVYGTSKRSSDYKMNVANVLVGGTAGNQTIEIFIGGSSENIAQIYNTINGENLTGDMKVLESLAFAPSYYGPVTFQEEIWATLADGLGITIDENTTLAELLTPMGLYDAENSVVKNGKTQVKLSGFWGGGTYDQQLSALEKHIIDNKMTLVEVYEMVSTVNQGDDNRDTVAGATVMFDPKIVETFRIAAGIEEAGTETETVTENGKTTVTVQVKGLADMTVEVTIENGEITEMVVTDHSETASIGGELIEDGEFINLIIENQADLDSVDAEAGATLTSDALIEAARAALEEVE